ncbi:hypothetical protein V8E55_011436 [Tylopilus felleus]
MNMMMKYFENAQLSEVDMLSQPMPACQSGQSGPPYTPDLVYRREDRAAVDRAGSTVNECRGCDAQIDKSAISYHFTTPIEPVRQIKQSQDKRSASSSTTTQKEDPKIHAPCPIASCRWLHGGWICMTAISCKNVSSHFKLHGIRYMHEEEEIPCRWEGCFANVFRKNFVRHICECHLHHVRGKGH